MSKIIDLADKMYKNIQHLVLSNNMKIICDNYNKINEHINVTDSICECVLLDVSDSNGNQILIKKRYNVLIITLKAFGERSNLFISYKSNIYYTSNELHNGKVQVQILDKINTLPENHRLLFKNYPGTYSDLINFHDYNFSYLYDLDIDKNLLDFYLNNLDGNKNLSFYQDH